MGCLTQINLSSLSEGRRFTQKKLFHYIAIEYVHFIGTDCHHIDYRMPEYARHIDLIKKKLGNSFIEKLQTNMARRLGLNE
jgi:tyrosine-protein phosphatase YwqE